MHIGRSFVVLKKIVMTIMHIILQIALPGNRYFGGRSRRKIRKYSGGRNYDQSRANQNCVFQYLGSIDNDSPSFDDLEKTPLRLAKPHHRRLFASTALVRLSANIGFSKRLLIKTAAAQNQNDDDNPPAVKALVTVTFSFTTAAATKKSHICTSFHTI